MLSGLAAVGPARAQSEAPAGGEPGVWQEHQVDFPYLGFTSHYSCDGLQDKLELLLRQLGARGDAKVTTYGCDRGFGVPSRFPRATLKFATLQPLDASGAAPAGGIAATATVTAATPVAGVWRAVQLAPNHPFALQDGDCELMEQFRDKLLPLFATRAQQIQLTCVPYQDIGPFSVQLQVFGPPPSPAKPS
jgi:hypothetical protein